MWIKRRTDIVPEIGNKTEQIVRTGKKWERERERERERDIQMGTKYKDSSYWILIEESESMKEREKTYTWSSINSSGTK